MLIPLELVKGNKNSCSFYHLIFLCFISGTGHIIRKFISSDAAELKFGVHLNFIDRNQVRILI